MSHREEKNIFKAILAVLLVVAALLCFLSGLSNLSHGSVHEEKQQLEQAVRRAAVSCYATEGIYPPDLEYLQQHYGIQISSSHFVVSYEFVASNLMPDITVLEK